MIKYKIGDMVSYGGTYLGIILDIVYCSKLPYRIRWFGESTTQSYDTLDVMIFVNRFKELNEQI